MDKSNNSNISFPTVSSAPVSDTISTELPSARRIHIIEDSDDELAGPQSIETEVSVAQQQPEAESKLASKAATKSKPKAIKSSSQASVSTTLTVFELQRLLEKAMLDRTGAALHALFDSFEAAAPTSSSSSSSGGGSAAGKGKKATSSGSSTVVSMRQQVQRMLVPLMEPELLCLFLSALTTRIDISSESSDPSNEAAEEAIESSLDWLEWVSGPGGCRSFSLLMSLLSTSEREKVRAPLVSLADRGDDRPTLSARAAALLTAL